MLAFLRGARARQSGIEQRVGASLGLFAGVALPGWRESDRIGWQLPRVGELPARNQRQRLLQSLTCRPARLPGGIVALLHGWIDNCADLARELGCSPGDQAMVYAHAVRAWGDGADQRIHGTYCAIYDDPAVPGLRLARSAISAPPLYYTVDIDGIGAASVPRALEAMGLERKINRRRIADSMYFNLSESESYLQGSHKVPYGAIVHLAPGSIREHRYYDPLTVPPQPSASTEDYVREADRLLTEACELYRASARQPGVLLSGGLDSSNVAARLLRAMPPEARLHAFTYVPLAGHGQREIPGALIDEGPAVLAFAAMHPQIVPHLINNPGIEFDHRLEDMFLAMGTATPNLAGFYRYHGIYEAARAAGCDMLLSADNGNCTFSSSGEWGPAEFLRSGRLVQLVRALRADRAGGRSLVWRLFAQALVPMLPDAPWRLAMRLRGKDTTPDNLRISALSEAPLAEFDVAARSTRAGTQYFRTRYAWRKDLLRDQFARGDVEGSDMIQGWEQLYEVSMRDPTSYRPLVDFCLGLPTDMFMRDGVDRWLARELGRDLMPEAQRLMPGHGQHSTDWHLRLTPRLADMRREVAAIRADPLLAEMIDTAALDRDLDEWPAAATLEDRAFTRFAMRLPRAIAMGRYVRFMTGRNAG